jgi:hypothetical protein
MSQMRRATREKIRIYTVSAAGSSRVDDIFMAKIRKQIVRVYHINSTSFFCTISEIS